MVGASGCLVALIMFGCVTIAGLFVVVGLVSGVGCGVCLRIACCYVCGFACGLFGFSVSCLLVGWAFGGFALVWCVVLGLIVWFCWC